MDEQWHLNMFTYYFSIEKCEMTLRDIIRCLSIIACEVGKKLEKMFLVRTVYSGVVHGKI